MKKYLSYVLVIIVTVLISVVVTQVLQNRKYDISRVEESLVYIEAIGEDFINNGSGFVYKIKDNKNYIVTNYHVVEGYREIYVYNSNKRKVSAEILDFDKKSDIAILEINDDLNLKEVIIGDSSKLNIGDEVFAVGTPIDYRYFSTFTKGIVSYLNRNIEVDGNIYNTIQIDASINGGNSGGPLINNKGNVVGIVFIKESDIEDVGFALPINDLIESVNKMLKIK